MNKMFNKRIIILTIILISILFTGSIFNIAHAQEKQTENSSLLNQITSFGFYFAPVKDTYNWILQKFTNQTDDGKTAEQRAAEKQNEDDLAEIIRNSVNPPGEIDKRLEESIRRQSGGGSNFDGTFVPLAGIPGVTDAEAAKNPSKFFNGMFMFGISIAAFLAVLMIAIGGIQYMSTDAVSGKTEGKERIQYAVMGLLLVLFSWILLRQINPEILNFNFLNTPTSNYNNTNTGAFNGVKIQNGSGTNDGSIRYTGDAIKTDFDEERGYSYQVVGKDKDGKEIRFYPDLQNDPNPEYTIQKSDVQPQQNNNNMNIFNSSNIEEGIMTDTQRLQRAVDEINKEIFQ